MKLSHKLAFLFLLAVSGFLIGFNFDYMKERARIATISYLEKTAMSLRKDSIQYKNDSTMPVRLSLSDLERVDAEMAHKADVIAKILGEIE